MRKRQYYGNTLRCLAVNPERRGEGLLERIVLEIKRRYLDGVTKLFVYTKPEAAMQLEPLGFYGRHRLSRCCVYGK